MLAACACCQVVAKGLSKELKCLEVFAEGFCLFCVVFDKMSKRTSPCARLPDAYSITQIRSQLLMHLDDYGMSMVVLDSHLAYLTIHAHQLLHVVTNTIPNVKVVSLAARCSKAKPAGDKAKPSGDKAFYGLDTDRVVQEQQQSARNKRLVVLAHIRHPLTPSSAAQLEVIVKHGRAFQARSKFKYQSHTIAFLVVVDRVSQKCVRSSSALQKTLRLPLKAWRPCVHGKWPDVPTRIFVQASRLLSTAATSSSETPAPKCSASSGVKAASSGVDDALASSGVEVASSSVEAAHASSGVDVAPASSGVEAASSGVDVAPASSGVDVAPASSGVEVAPASCGVECMMCSSSVWCDTNCAVCKQPMHSTCADALSRGKQALACSFCAARELPKVFHVPCAEAALSSKQQSTTKANPNHEVISERKQMRKHKRKHKALQGTP